MIDKAKNYVLGAFNFLLFSVSWMDAVDSGIKIIAGILGIILTGYLIIKAKHDIEEKKLANKEKRQLIEMRDLEIYERMQRNKK